MIEIASIGGAIAANGSMSRQGYPALEALRAAMLT